MRGVETIAAIVLQHADVGAGIARFQDADRRSNIDPVRRLVTGAEAVILRVARRDAEENIVSGKELDIAAGAELVCACGKADQPGASVDLGKVFTSVSASTATVHVPSGFSGCTDACSAVGQGRCGTREESLDLGVVNSLRDFPALKAVSNVRRDSLGEVIFQKEGIGRPLLAEKIIAVVHNQVSRGAGIVLWTRRRGKRRRAGGGVNTLGFDNSVAPKRFAVTRLQFPGILKPS